MKIVINRCFGGFGLSDRALEMYSTAKKLNPNNCWESEIARDDPILVHIVESLGEEANGKFSELKVVDIPDDVDWIVEEYDGMEYVAERHRVWS